jgi:hypothetical protein
VSAAINYVDFLTAKMQMGSLDGFAPIWMPDFLFDFQKSMVDWAIRKGRAGLFEDCGLGKTPQELVWAENVVRKTNKPVLNLTPLGVAAQTAREADKFGIECHRSTDGKIRKCVNVANYERLHYFNPDDFGGIVLDESSILKAFDGTRRRQITAFMRQIPYRLLGTATAAPNDYIELGTSSEALGYIDQSDMLARFFKNEEKLSEAERHGRRTREGLILPKWLFKGHAEEPFWKWVCSWARALRKPSDVGFDDGPFILPPLHENEHNVKARSLPPGKLFHVAATSIREQLEERRRTINERCERVAELVNHKEPALVWCHLNPEGDLLEKEISGSVQVSGDDSDQAKEEKFLAFVTGEARVLVTKPKIGCWGLNFQHCAHQVTFPSHSFEQYYQGVRRCWRFGQKLPVTIDIVTTEAERGVMANLQYKQAAADKMFSRLVAHMNQAIHISKSNEFQAQEQIPAWL